MARMWSALMGAENGGVARRGWPAVLTVLLAVGVVLAVLWAGLATMGNRAPGSPSQEPSTYTVGEETVERSLPVIVVAERSRELVAVNLLDGVVTRVPDLRGAARIGAVVYEVAGVPVRVVEGDVPFHRELRPGLEGEDVVQLQAALIELGHLGIDPDGHFGAATSEAVRQWRRESGFDGDRVPLGELIAVPDLPRMVLVADGIQVGTLAGVGSEALFVVSEEPRFEVPLSESQAQAIDSATAIVLEHDGLEWHAEATTSRREPERGQVVLMLAGPEGGPVCGEACATLPAQGRVQLRGRIVSVPPTTGPAVPVTALRTDAAGTVWVRLEAGGTRKVVVLAMAGGLAIVEGLEVGERILISGGSNGGDDG